MITAITRLAKEVLETYKAYGDSPTPLEMSNILLWKIGGSFEVWGNALQPNHRAMLLR